MECSKPGAIRDEELIAYLAGERVRPDVEQHLAHCPRCTAQLAAYQRMDRKLSSNLYRWDCPSSQILGEYHLGLLDNEQVTAVESHLSRCLLCTAEQTALTAFLDYDPMLVERMPASPKSVTVRSSSQNSHSAVRETKQLLDQWSERAQTGVRRIIAQLLPAQPRLAYQRNMQRQGTSWPRRYTAEDVSVSIQVEQGPERPGRKGSLQLMGLVNRKGATLEALQGTSVQLASTTNTVYTQQIDELGNFVFASIVPATYTLELQLPERVIVIEQLAVSLHD